jgi:hypothetical protein
VFDYQGSIVSRNITCIVSTNNRLVGAAIY